MAIKERWKGFPALPPDTVQALERLAPLFEREGVLLAYLFGSLAKGGEANDLAILVENQPAYRLRAPIAECLGIERLDLVDLHTASPVLRFEILSGGRLLYASNEEAQNRYELETLHLYRDTRHTRRRQEQYLRERIASWCSRDHDLARHSRATLRSTDDE